MGIAKVYGVNASPFVRKVRAVLFEKQVPYELEPVMPISAGEDFLKLSPLGRIPCYQDDRVTLPDSSVICAYLERVYPEPALYPSDPVAYGRALWYEEYGDTRLVETVYPVFRERFMHAHLLREPCDEELVAHHMSELLPPIFDYLEAEVGEGAGIVAGCFSIADIAVASPLVNLEHSGEHVDAGRWPRLAAWYERICSRPCLQTLVDEERAAFAAIR